MGARRAKERAFQEVGQHEQMQGSWKQREGKSVVQFGQEVKVRVGVMEGEMGRTSGGLGCWADKRELNISYRPGSVCWYCLLMSLPCGQKAYFGLFLSFLMY